VEPHLTVKNDPSAVDKQPLQYMLAELVGISGPSLSLFLQQHMLLNKDGVPTAAASEWLLAVLTFGAPRGLHRWMRWTAEDAAVKTAKSLVVALAWHHIFSPKCKSGWDMSVIAKELAALPLGTYELPGHVLEGFRRLPILEQAVLCAGAQLFNGCACACRH
jgi:hypothetical protein